MPRLLMGSGQVSFIRRACAGLQEMRSLFLIIRGKEEMSSALNMRAGRTCGANMKQEFAYVFYNKGESK